MKPIANKSKNSFQKNTFERDRREAKGPGGDKIDIMEDFLTDRTNAISMENCTPANVSLFSVSAYHQADLFVKTEQIEIPDILLHDFGFLHVIFLPASFRMYSFD